MHLSTFLQDLNRLGLTQSEGIEKDIAWGHVTSLVGLARPSIDGPIFIYRAPILLGGPSPPRVQLWATTSSSPAERIQRCPLDSCLVVNIVLMCYVVAAPVDSFCWL